jgi:hypothetical protein
MSKPMMPIAHAPRLEVVLSPEGKPGPEWSEIPADALYDAMLSHFINEPDHWRARAEEARILASQMHASLLAQRAFFILSQSGERPEP